jgi:hypothetical protein
MIYGEISIREVVFWDKPMTSMRGTPMTAASFGISGRLTGKWTRDLSCLGPSIYVEREEMLMEILEAISERVLLCAESNPVLVATTRFHEHPTSFEQTHILLERSPVCLI